MNWRSEMSEEMKVGEFFALPLTVNDTYAENELRDGYGDLVFAMEGNAHELRLIAKSVNNHDTLTEQVRQLRELVKSAYIEGCHDGYSEGLSDGQSWSSNKVNLEPDESWEASESKSKLEATK